MNYKRLIALITVMTYTPRWIRGLHTRCNTLYLFCGSITKSTAKLWRLTI